LLIFSYFIQQTFLEQFAYLARYKGAESFESSGLRRTQNLNVSPNRSVFRKKRKTRQPLIEKKGSQTFALTLFQAFSASDMIITTSCLIKK